eukprot:m.95852 g.95852  ORF g.95852 m.95852 type:complete len:70 (-) comp16618_c0_seq2:971-1180(-)
MVSRAMDAALLSAQKDALLVMNEEGGSAPPGAIVFVFYFLIDSIATTTITAKITLTTINMMHILLRAFF